jgi:hypothetical protein
MLKHTTFILFSLTTVLIADPPVWDFYAPDYEHVMSVTSRVYDSNNADLGAPSDLLGAFYEEECVGIAEADEVPVFLGGGYAFLIQVYSNMDFGEEEDINFEFYSNAADTSYNINETQPFVSDAIVGNLVDPVMLHIEESNNTNNAPIAENATYGLDEDNTTTAYLSATDEDGDALTFVIQSGPNNATINLIVNAVNDAPYLYSIPDAETNAGEIFVYDLQAVDVDGDDLTYTATIVSGEGTVTLSNNILTAEGSVPNTTLEISIVVSDGVATDQTSFFLTILGNSCEDEYSQGFLDGSATGDVNGDGTLNIIDIVQSIEMILSGE